VSRARPHQAPVASVPEESAFRAPEGAASPLAKIESIARRVIAATVGCTLLAIGAVLLVLPGPGLLAIWIGLGVLAAEFAWARRWLRRSKRAAAQAIRSSPD